MQKNDSQTIGAILRGDRDQYGVLVDKYKKMVYAIAWSRLGDRDLSEDAAQETFIKAYSYLGTLRNPDAFSAWLARIARNVCGSFHRRAKREHAFTQRLGILESAETPPAEHNSHSLEEQLWQSFADLPAIHREALTLFHVEGKSAREAAAALGISEEALRGRLHRARIALREQLERRLEDTLDNLQPSTNFTRSVFALLPLAPKGAAGAGGAVAVLAKLAASLSFMLWIMLFHAASMFGTATWLNRAAQADIKDTPENQWRKALVRRGAAQILPFVVVVCLLGTLPWILIYNGIGIRALCAGLAAFLVPTVWYGVRFLRVNTGRYAVGEMLSCTILFAALGAIGFGHAPFMLTFYPAWLLFMLMVLATFKDKPRRPDYNLFLRRATGGMKEIEATPQPLHGPLTGTQLHAFMRFLGEQWLVRDYALRDGVLFLVIPAARPKLRNMLSLTAGSYIAIERNGTCTARISAADMREIQTIEPTCPGEEDLQVAVCHAVRCALDCFLRNELAEASAALAGHNDIVVYGRDYERTGYYRAHRIGLAASCITLILFVLLMLIRFLLDPKWGAFH